MQLLHSTYQHRIREQSNLNFSCYYNVKLILGLACVTLTATEKLAMAMVVNANEDGHGGDEGQGLTTSMFIL